MKGRLERMTGMVTTALAPSPAVVACTEACSTPAPTLSCGLLGSHGYLACEGTDTEMAYFLCTSHPQSYCCCPHLPSLHATVAFCPKCLPPPHVIDPASHSEARPPRLTSDHWGRGHLLYSCLKGKFCVHRGLHNVMGAHYSESRSAAHHDGFSLLAFHSSQALLNRNINYLHTKRFRLCYLW